MELKQLKCKQCNWHGNTDEVDWDTVETCMGDDKIEICPKCGSMEVVNFYPADNSNQPKKPTT